MLERWREETEVIHASPSIGQPRSPNQSGDDPLDVAAFGKLHNLLGDAKVALLLSKLTDQLETVVTETAINACDRMDVARTAHAAVSSAGVLGFRTFAKLCADLEAACATGGDLSAVRTRLLEERCQVARRVAQLIDRSDAGAIMPRGKQGS